VAVQTSEAQSAAAKLGLDYVHFQPVSPSTSGVLFPLLDNAEPVSTHIALLGSLNNVLLVAAHVRYQDTTGMWLNNVIHKRGHFILSFPQRIAGLPDFIALPVPGGLEMLTKSPEETRRMVELVRTCPGIGRDWYLVMRDGRLTVWQGDLEPSIGRIIPGDAEGTAEYVRAAVKIHQQLALAVASQAHR
jgi:hypothetical protein